MEFPLHPHQYLIEKKLDDELTPEEQEQFAQKLVQDAAFAEEYEQQQSMIETLHTYHQQQLKEELKTMFAAVDARRHQRQRYGYYGIAAAILLLLVAVPLAYHAWWKDPQQVFATYYEVYTADPVLRGKESWAYDKGMELYRQGAYQQAIPYFEQSAAADQRLGLFLGNCYLQTGQSAQAIESLRPLLSVEDAIIGQHAAWYTALAYLQSGEIEKATTLLQNIKDSEGIYQQKATDVLKALD